MIVRDLGAAAALAVLALSSAAAQTPDPEVAQQENPLASPSGTPRVTAPLANVYVLKNGAEDVIATVRDGGCAAEMHVDLVGPTSRPFVDGGARGEVLSGDIRAEVSSKCPAMGRLWVYARAQGDEYTLFVAVLERATEWSPRVLFSERTRRRGA